MTPALPLALVVGLSAAGCSTGSTSSSASTATASPTQSATTEPARTTSAPASPSAAPTTASTPAASPSRPPFSADCIEPSEYDSVVHYKGGHDTVEALELGSGKVGVVLAHQSGQDLCAWQPYAHALAKKGYRVLDLSFGEDLMPDVVGAAAALRAKGSTRVVLIGASMGGTTVVAAAAKIKPAVAAVIDLSGPATYLDLDALRAARALTMPALFVVSKNDTEFASDVQAVYRAAIHSPGRKLVIRNSYEHGIDMVQGSTRTAIEAFLQAHA